MSAQPMCAVCYDLLAQTSDLTAVTQCCQQAVCDHCAGDIADINFSCANCHSSTAVWSPTATVAIEQFQAELNRCHHTIMKTARGYLSQLLSESSHFQYLATKLANNMLAITDRNHSEAIMTAVQQYHVAYTKTIALAQADHQDLIQRAQAQLKYLAELTRQLHQVELDQCRRALQLVQLDYVLTALDKPQPVARLPHYSVMMALGNKLVIDNIEEQLKAWIGLVNPRPTVTTVILTDLQTKLDQQFHNRYDPNRNHGFLIPYSVSQADQNNQSKQPSRLLCLSGHHGYVLVSLSGEILYYHPYHDIVAANGSWVVSLQNQTMDDLHYYLRINRLEDLIAAGLEGWRNLTSYHINLANGQVAAELRQDNLLMWSQQLTDDSVIGPGDCHQSHFHNWLLGNGHDGGITATLQHHRILRPDQSVEAVGGGSFWLHQKQQAWLGCFDDQGEFYDLEVAPKTRSWQILPNGRILLHNYTTVLWRPGQVVDLTKYLRRSKTTLTTDPESGRLVAIFSQDQNIRLDFY